MNVCTFDGSPAVGRFEFTGGGCAARETERVQDLCLQHVVKAEPIGTMILIEDHSIDGSFGRWWRGEVRV